MSEVVELAVRTWIITQRDEELESIAQSIQRGEISLLALVKSLKDYLTAEEAETRVKGVTLLTEVIKQLPDDSFNFQSTKVLCAFFISKLDTVDEVIPALKGLLRLSSMPTFSAQECKDTVEGLFTLNMRAHVQSTRHIVFLIIDGLMARHRATLQSLGPPFVKGYISLADGEKDPRNLLIAFALDRVILLEFDISDYVEQLYDITFCYFPITFKAPANDPYGVTGNDLVVALRGCLSASPLLGSLGMPLFIEKLNAGSPSTKKDTMATIAICLPIYGQGIAQQFADKLWDGLKVEIFQPVDPQVQEGALEVMKTLVQTCHPDGLLSHGIGQRILRTCSEALKEPQTTKGQAAVKVVTSLISSSDSIANNVLQELIPQAMVSYDSAEEPSVRPSILVALSAILEARRIAGWDVTDENADPIFTHKDALLSRLVASIRDASTTSASIKALHQLLFYQLLTKDELSYVIHNLTDSLIKARTAEDDITSDILAILVTLSNSSPKLVEDITLQALFALLPDLPPSKDNIEAQDVCIHVLAALEVLCVQPDLFGSLVVRLLTRIELLVNRRVAEPDVIVEELNSSVAYVHAMFRTIYATLERKVERKDLDLAKYIERFVPRLYYLFLEPILISGRSKPVAESDALIGDGAKIIALIVASLNHERQRVWINSVFDAFFNGKLSLIASAHEPFPANTEYNPLKVLGGPSPQDCLTPLFTAALVGLHPDTAIPVPNLSGWLHNLLHIALQSQPVKRKAICELTASIVNKHADECAELVNIHLDHFWSEHIADEGRATGHRLASLEVWASVVQALIVRIHPSSIPLARRLFSLFGDEWLAPHAAKRLGTLPNLTGSVLNKRYHAIIRLLHAQRLFGAIGSEIQAAFVPGLDDSHSNAYLIAISTLIPSIPKGTYAEAIELLFPLLLRGLELAEPSLRANIVDSFVVVVETEGESHGLNIVTSHLRTLVGAMLRNTRFERHQQSVARLKCGALRFLAALPSRLKQEDVQPFKSQVLRELQLVLDDPSKAVRREAVIARSKWYKSTN